MDAPYRKKFGKNKDHRTSVQPYSEKKTIKKEEFKPRTITKIVG